MPHLRRNAQSTSSDSTRSHSGAGCSRLALGASRSISPLAIRSRTSTFSSIPSPSVSCVYMSCLRPSGGGIPFGPPAGMPCKAGAHGWAGQRPRRHRERGVGGARDGVRGLPAGGPKGIGQNNALGGVTGCRAPPGGTSRSRGRILETVQFGECSGGEGDRTLRAHEGRPVVPAGAHGRPGDHVVQRRLRRDHSVPRG